MWKWLENLFAPKPQEPHWKYRIVFDFHNKTHEGHVNSRMSRKPTPSEMSRFRKQALRELEESGYKDPVIDHITIEPL